MRADRDISKRMREILTSDKVNIKQGFRLAMHKDIKKLMSDYFDLDGDISISIEQRGDGKYAVHMDFNADRIRQFDTTFDVKRY